MVMVPTRGRRKQCERLLASFRETTDNADISFILDPDDEDTYEGMDWGTALAGVLSPREYLSGKLNSSAASFRDLYDVLMFAGDDHVFRTPHWDTIMLGVLDGMGGTGMVYPDDKRRADIPEIIMITTDIVKELGWFAEPGQAHYSLDDIWAYLGRKSDLLRYCPEVVIEHHHYLVDKETERDATYRETEENLGQRDKEALMKWVSISAPAQLALLRRKFNPDVKWARGKVRYGS